MRPLLLLGTSTFPFTSMVLRNMAVILPPAVVRSIDSTWTNSGTFERRARSRMSVSSQFFSAVKLAEVRYLQVLEIRTVASTLSTETGLLVEMEEDRGSKRTPSQPASRSASSTSIFYFVACAFAAFQPPRQKYLGRLCHRLGARHHSSRKATDVYPFFPGNLATSKG